MFLLVSIGFVLFLFMLLDSCGVVGFCVVLCVCLCC